MSRNPQTDSIVKKIANMEPANREAQLVAGCAMFEQQRDSLARQLKDAKKVIDAYESQWVDEHV